MESLMARKMWRTLEPYHGMIYFAPEATAAYQALGVTGLDGYFVSRAAAMGAVPAEVVVATFFNFNPEVVHAALPAAWAVAAPDQLLSARLEAADGALRRVLGDDIAAPTVTRAAALAQTAAEACACAGRPLYAGHASLPWPEPPHLALWHAVTLLREFRGDGHIATLVAAGLSGLDALVVHAASGEVDRSVLQSSRRWDAAAWDAAVAGLADRNVVHADGSFTTTGAELRTRIEADTDVLALAPWAALGADGCDELRALVRPLSKAIVAGGTFALSPSPRPST